MTYRMQETIQNQIRGLPVFVATWHIAIAQIL
jgi:hypothetical protein